MTLRIAVLIAGIADAKWRASELGLPLDGSAPGLGVARKLSPFDEAAVECGLKLRDMDSSVHLHFVVACDSPDAGLLRAVSAFRPTSLQGVVVPQVTFWDAQALAIQLADTTVCGASPADIVLVGREFGDFDDGVFAPCLAQALGHVFIALAQEVRTVNEGLVLMRERGNGREFVHCQEHVVASVTNAKSNRLRYPLMKNVMAAKREPVGMQPIAGLPGRAYRHAASISAVVTKPRNDVPCQMVAGTEGEQAKAVADFLNRLLKTEALI